MSSLEVGPSTGGPPAGSESPRRRMSSPRVWGLALLAGAVAGLAAWSIGEVVHARVAPPKMVVTASPTGGFLSGDEILRRSTSKRSAQLLEAGLTFGSLGAALGLALGLAGGVAGGSARASWRPALAGLVLAGLAGAAVPQVVLPTYYRVVNPDTNELFVGIMTQVVLSAVIGLAAGAAFGIGFGRRSHVVNAAIGGTLGAIAGALVYEMAGAIAFPMDETSTPISVTAVTRLFARLAVSILAAAGMAMAALNQGEPAIPSSAAPSREAAPEPAQASGLEA